MSDTISTTIGSVFWLYLATILTKSNYGELQFLISVAGLACGLSLIASSNTITVYEVKKRGMTGILFLLSLLCGIIVSAALFITYSRFDIIFLTFGLLMSEMTIGYLLGKKMFARYAMFWILQKALMISLAIPFYYINGLEGIVYGIGLSYIPFAILIFKGFRESTFNFSLLNKNYGFIISNYGIKLSVYTKRNLDKLIIVPLLGYEVLGEYSLAFQLYLSMMIFSSMASKFLVFSDAAGTNSNKFKIIVLSVSIGFAILGITAGPSVIPILFPEYINSVKILPILSLAVIPNTVAVIYSSRFAGDEKSKIVLLGTMINMSAYLLLIVLLSATYGLIGISMSFLISSIIYATYLVITHKMQRMPTVQ